MNASTIEHFSKIETILLAIKAQVTPDSDVVWTKYNTATEFFVDLNEAIGRLRQHDFSILPLLKLNFAPTGIYQEIAISNGWGTIYLKLAAAFDASVQMLYITR